MPVRWPILSATCVLSHPRTCHHPRDGRNLEVVAGRWHLTLPCSANPLGQVRMPQSRLVSVEVPVISLGDVPLLAVSYPVGSTSISPIDAAPTLLARSSEGWDHHQTLCLWRQPRICPPCSCASPRHLGGIYGDKGPTDVIITTINLLVKIGNPKIIKKRQKFSK